MFWKKDCLRRKRFNLSSPVCDFKWKRLNFEFVGLWFVITYEFSFTYTNFNIHSSELHQCLMYFNTHHHSMYSSYCSLRDPRNVSGVSQELWDLFHPWVDQLHPLKMCRLRSSDVYITWQTSWWKDVEIMSIFLLEVSEERKTSKVGVPSSGVSICVFVLVKKVNWVPYCV